MSDLMGINLAQGGAVGILALVVMMVLLGRLVPRSVLEDVRADRDARVAEMTAERDTWRAAHIESEAARRIAQGQVGELLELSRTADHLLRSLPQPTREGGTDAVDPASAPS
ncbi:hypothetical protein [Streptomyces sp. NPDC005877]|uniref:hypothetical protein n=1 Tax=Streptomyces sp. NPDC005877 TaxID=3155346 RepID=UPI0033DA32F9